MGFKSAMKANKAYRLQRSGTNLKEAEKLYEEAFAEGTNEPRFLLAYALMIIRDGQYQKAKEFLVKHQKAPGITPSQRVELLVYYATCCFRLGNVDKGISTLEQQCRKMENGLLYQTLGYLYIEKYDLEHRPDFTALNAEPDEEAPEAAEDTEKADAAENPEEAGAAENPEQAEGAEEKQAPLTPEQEWEAGVEKAETFIRDSVEYDDEDPICLDNMAQFVYRVKGDKAGAKKWFEKAIARKPGQIDTLWFLSRYDLEAGDRAAALEKLEEAAKGRFSPLNYCSRERISSEIKQLKGEQQDV